MKLQFSRKAIVVALRCSGDDADSRKNNYEIPFIIFKKLVAAAHVYILAVGGRDKINK